jgi:hypothetical protein
VIQRFVKMLYPKDVKITIIDVVDAPKVQSRVAATKLHISPALALAEVSSQTYTAALRL